MNPVRTIEANGIIKPYLHYLWYKEKRKRSWDETENRYLIFERAEKYVWIGSITQASLQQDILKKFFDCKSAILVLSSLLIYYNRRIFKIYIIGTVPTQRHRQLRIDNFLIWRKVWTQCDGSTEFNRDHWIHYVPWSYALKTIQPTPSLIQVVARLKQTGLSLCRISNNL